VSDQISDELFEFTNRESAECGYIVTPGYRYCRECGGGGLVGEFMQRDECTECGALGEHKLTDEELAEIEEDDD